FPRPVRRVSVGNPDVAGIVVVGPRSVMINGKVLPPREGLQQGPTVAQMRLATVSNTTFTPEPYFKETTPAGWEEGASEPEVHTVFVAEFSTRAVMLDVTVAQLNRTAMEQHGIDFRQIGTTFVSAFFLGGGAAPVLGQTVPAMLNQ